MYRFDTDTLSNVVKRRPSEGLIQKLQGLPKTLQYTSSIDIGEIYYGAWRSQNKALILQAFEKHVFPNVNVLPFDIESGRIFGTLKAELEMKGNRFSELELRIASVALHPRLVLVTGNVKHFKVMPGLQVENGMT